MKLSFRALTIAIFCFSVFAVSAQFNSGINWKKDGSGYFKMSEGNIIQVSLPDNAETVIVPGAKLTATGRNEPIRVRSYFFSDDYQKVLIYTNTKKVWRYDTRGDYWVFEIKTGNFMQLGKSLPPSSLMFAKFSPDGTRVGYVSGHNLFVEELSNSTIKQLTTDGSRKMINGTFDWVYEEEFDCRDGFRWSPDSKKIAFWQIDAKETKDYLMLNTTDSIYPRAIPVEYPVAGEPPSPFKIGVVDVSTVKQTWMDIPTDPVLGSYIPRMEWAANSSQLIVQHLNRRQNTSDLMLCDASSGASATIYSEKDNAWIDVEQAWDDQYKSGGWDWLNGGKDFLWAADKDGWRHLYRVSRDGKKETLITIGAYDVMKINRIDEKGNYVYFTASPNNATQAYLYRISLDGKGKAERLSPANQQGTHDYAISPNARFAMHTFSSHYIPRTNEWISLPSHDALDGHKVYNAITQADSTKSRMSFLKIKTEEGIEMDAWMVKPANFDPAKKYPVVFFVYTEPAGQNVRDAFGAGNNRLYQGNMSDDGYIYMSIDNRGTPVPKGRDWRKCVYRKIGIINIRDQALAAKEVLKWSFVDSSRVAVWGWSGGGSATLNLMFQFPDLYKTGIAIAAVGNQLTYDNIYQERYMGLPQENRQDFVTGSPITYAKNLKGNLLYVHGTGDDNVHYANAEMLINELVKHNRQFQLMSYPNRTHSISEGEGTSLHLATLYTKYLKEHCPPGGR